MTVEVAGQLREYGYGKEQLPEATEGQYRFSIPVTADIPVAGAFTLPPGVSQATVTAYDDGHGCVRKHASLSAAPPKIFAILVGVNRFTQFQSPLRFARYDAAAIRDYLVHSRGVPAGNVQLLTDTPDPGEKTISNRGGATKREFRTALRTLAQNPDVKNDSIVLVFLSTHGYHINDPDHYDDTQYFMLEDSSPSSDDTMVGRKFLERELKNIPSSTKIVLLDACYSGFLEDDKEDTDAKTIRGLEILPSKDIPKFEYIKGVYELASSTGSQRSYELKEKEHGAFTYFLLEAAQKAEADDHMVTIRSVYLYLQKEVTTAVQQALHRLQEVDQHLDSDADRFVWAFR
jgi:uncharacterized caspase-like protein